MLCLILLLPPASGRAQATVGQRVLERRTVVLTITDSGAAATCLGFRLTHEDFPSNVDLVLTAAHCLTDMGGNPSVTVTSLTRQAGRSAGAFVWAEFDVAFLLVTPRVGTLEPLRYPPTEPQAEMPVLAMVRGPAGAPTIAPARVLGQYDHVVYLGMAAAPGSSGGGVVDPSGFLIGMIAWGTPIQREGTGTPFVQAIGVGAILGLWDQGRERITARARELSR